MAEYGKIEGKTFLITGAASGIGAAYLEPFLREGAKGIAMLDIAEEKGKALAEKLNEVYPGKVVFLKCDLSNEESIATAFNKVVDKFGTVDVVINNAGILNDSPEQWRKSCEVNFIGLISMTLKGLSHMRIDEGGKSGTIINISSVAALTRRPYLPIYSGTKSGVLQFSNNMATDPFFENTGVRILTICFGATATPLLENLVTTGYDKNNCKTLALVGEAVSRAFQKAESAAKGVVEMFKRGSNGTIWFSRDDKPVEDITAVVDDTFDYLDKKLQLN